MCGGQENREGKLLSSLQSGSKIVVTPQGIFSLSIVVFHLLE